MDIKRHINIKSDELIRYADELKLVDIDWKSPITFDCASLQPNDVTSLVAKSPDLSAGKAYPGIYYFRILNGINGAAVVEALRKYKSKKERSCPEIENKRGTDSIYLYCGSVKGGNVNLHGRFIQHLGYSHKNLYELQLTYWAKQFGLQLEYNYGFLKMEQSHLTELVEASMTKALKPLVGKMAK